MTARRRHQTVLLGALFLCLLAYVLLSYGLSQKFLIVLIIVVLAAGTWDDGFKSRQLSQKAIIDRLLLPTLVLVVLPLIYTLWIVGLQESLWVFGIILLGVISWTAGFVYGRMQYNRKNMIVTQLSFSLVSGCILFYIFTFYEFSQALLFTAVTITYFNLSLPFLSPKQDQPLLREYQPVYSQSNWPEEFQQVLAVEIQDAKRERLPLWEHKDLLRNRYCRLAQKALDEGHRPEQAVKDFLEVSPPADDPAEIAGLILSSEAFHYVMSTRDEPRSVGNVPDPATLRSLYDGTNFEQVVRLLREIYLNSLEEIGETGTTIEPYQTPMAETHLNWMIEAMPNETERLYRENKLKDHLNRIVLRAEEVMDRLTAQGLRDDEALEIVTATILTSEIPYEEDEEGNPKHREQMEEDLRDEILLNILSN